MGADIGAHDRHGLTPSDIAVDKGFFDIAHFLLSVRNLRLDQIAEPGTAATGARQAPPAPVQPLATPGAPAREPPPATARAVMPPPPAPVPTVDETIIRPAGEAPPNVLHDPFDPEVTPLGAVLPIIGPLRGSESPATASAPVTSGPVRGETRPPSRAIATEIAETPSERAERSGPIAQEPGDPASLPPAKRGFFRRLVDGLVSDEAGPEADTPSDTAPSPAAPSVSDAPPEASEPPPVPTADDGLAGPAAPPADFPSLPVIEPETAEFAPTPALQPGPPAEEPVAPPALAEGTSVASAEEAAAEPTSGDLAPSPPANKGFFRRLIDRLGSGEAESEVDTPSDAAPSPAAPSVSDAPPEASEPPPVSVPTADDGLAGPAVPPADFPPLPVIEPETAAIASAPASQPGPPADESVAAPALAEGTSVASAEEAAAEPTSGDLAPPPPANKGFYRRLIDRLGSGEAESEVDTPSDAAPSAAAPSVSDAAPEASEPPADGIAAPATPDVDFEPLPAIDPEIAAIPPAPESPPEPPEDEPAPVPALAGAPPVASAEEATPDVDFEPLPAIDPEIAAIPPAPESPLEPPADGPAPVPVLAEAPPVASAEEAAAEPTPGDPAPSPPANRGFFRRLIDRLGSREAGSEADTPSDPAPSPATPPVSDAGPETSEPPPAPAAVDLRALPMIKPETAAIPPAPALQTGSPADDPVSPPVRAEGPLENTSTPRLTVRASPNFESARPSEPAKIVSATDPFDPNEAPRGAELPIVGAIIGPGTTAEAVLPPPITPPIAPPVPTTEEASAPRRRSKSRPIPRRPPPRSPKRRQEPRPRSSRRSMRLRPRPRGQAPRQRKAARR